jgi:hypothetical protein
MMWAAHESGTPRSALGTAEIRANGGELCYRQLDSTSSESSMST